MLRAEPLQDLEGRLASRIDHHGTNCLLGSGRLVRHPLHVGEGGVDGADGVKVIGFMGSILGPKRSV